MEKKYFNLKPINLIDLNPVQLKYYPFMISLDKCIGSCTVLTPEICVKKNQKTDILQ